MLEGLLHHKKEEKDYLCALLISEDRVDAALWETTKDGKVAVLKTSQEQYIGEWEKAIDAADKAVTAIEEGLPEAAELTKVVFGLFPEWLSDDRIKDDYLKKLKQLTKSLSLTPLGFVELPHAVVHLLTKDEGIQQTVILVGIESQHITLSLYKIGKLIGSITAKRRESISADIEAALGSFKDVEVLPSRMLLYGTIGNLDELKTELLNYPWQKKANFLHFPKVEILGNDFPIKAVANAASTEITPHPQNEETEETQVAVSSPAVDTGTSEEVAAIAQDLGFVTDKDVSIDRQDAKLEVEETVQNVRTVAVPTAKPMVDRPPAKKFQLPKLPKFSLPKLTFTLRLPRFNKLALIIGVVVILLLIGASTVAAYWVLPKATVKLLVMPQVLDKTEKITISLQAEKVDVKEKLLPGKEIEGQVNGSKTIATTGKKTVGDKAKGEVTIYNKTLNSKTFKAGSAITAGNLKFTLDGEVNVASASEGVGSLTYGTSKAQVTASDIGTASNVGPGTDFEFADLPTTSYSARNEKAFAGGTSREIATLSREDQSKARVEIDKELEDKTEAELSQKISSSEKLLDGSITSKVIEESFSKEIGEEASEVTIDATLSISALSYNESDFFSLLESIVSSLIPQNYEYKKEEAAIAVEEISEAGEGRYLIISRIRVNLLPKVEIGDLSKRLAGKSLSDATVYLQKESSVSGVEFDISAPLSSLKNQLPRNPANIKIVLSTL